MSICLTWEEFTQFYFSLSHVWVPKLNIQIDMGLIRLEFSNSVNGDFDYIVYKQKTNFKRFSGIRVDVWLDNLLGACFASLNFLTQKI